MKAFLLAAGFGRRFRPVTERIAKPLVPYLNVPLALAHLRRLKEAGFLQAGVNLHHLGEQVEAQLRDGAADLPELFFFREREILGTAGGLKNAAEWLAGEDFVLVNSDAAIEPDFPRLLSSHRAAGRPATLLLVENRDPDRYTPLQTEGDRVTGFGGKGDRPLLYTGVCVLSGRLLESIPPGETSLVADLWRPMLEGGRHPIGWISHDGPFADLGSPRDFLGASLEALDRGGPFPRGSGRFDPARRVLSANGARFDALRSVIGSVAAAPGAPARIEDSAVWDAVEIGEGARLRGCLAAGGRVPARAGFEDALLWPGPDGNAVAHPLVPVR